ncbi:MAG: Wzz/FepE/Etk N-terminal domain-containing protein [Candidatus Polarisedimenticolaceae bacterium]|nr:Wzz/FepE/Etk N-terminal domain-containing protein [Candidatus Polarisedimenticolaceae bacterium]
MKDIIEEILNNVRSGWRFRWYAIALAWVVAIIGWAAVYSLPNKFEATTRVYVDTKSVLRPLLQGLAVESDIGEQLSMMTKTLLSRPNLEKVIREADLDLLIESEVEMEALVRGMAKRILVSGGREKNLFTIQYVHETPEVAVKVVQELLNIFVESSIGDERIEADTATRFLDGQIASYEAKLVAAENRLTKFKRKNVGMLPGQDGGIFQRQQVVKRQHETALLALREAENQRNELNIQLKLLSDQKASTESKMQAVDVVQSPYQIRITALEQLEDELLLKYTEQHPDVVEISRKIVVLQDQDKASKEALSEESKSDNTGGLGENEALDQLKLQLATATANVAALNVREKTYRQKLVEMGLLMDTIPQVEAELTRLNRDYVLNKTNYDLLTQRRESAVISKDVDEAGDGVKFRIIDPPHAPSLPMSPKRELLSAVVLVAAFGIGAALAFLLSQLNPVFYSASSLRRETEYPVFGSISRVWTSNLKTKRRIEVAFFILSSTALFTLFVLVEVIYFMGGPDKVISQVRGLL